MRTTFIMEEYEKKLDNLQFKYRKEILERVQEYLERTYPREIKLVNTSEHYALMLILYRIQYQHHFTQGF